MQQVSKINKSNFHMGSFAQFQIVTTDIEDILLRKPDYISHLQRTGQVSSMYWYAKNGLYRFSSHWGIVGNCEWFINSNKSKLIRNTWQLCFCSWKSMREVKINKY